jgi:hypothetical protein
MDMLRKLVFVLAVVSGSAVADRLEDLSFAALEKRVALNALRKEANADRAAWPKGDVPGLDFTKSGNAIIAHTESGRHSDPIAGSLTNAPPFKLFHVEDDPYRLTPLARGIGLDKPEGKAKYRTDKYKPALQQMARAKYVLFVVAKVQEPKIDIAVKLDAVMHDFENNAREALWKALKARFPSAKIPTIVYLGSKE